MIRYPLTIFLSAFLLFQVQPLVGKMVLPWFGGSPAVWTSCMLFFQMLLLGGYAYAHFVSTRLPAKVLTGVHGGLLLLSLLFLPIAPSLAWKPEGSELPVLRIVGLLAFTVGLPYFLLSTTGPLLQESFRRETGRTPYRLYSLSNAGSLLALLSYPFVFEPALTLRVQRLGWSAGYAGFVLLCLWSTAEFLRLWSAKPTAESEPAPAASPRPPLRTILLWLALAACGSVMLLATTNQLCMEVTSVPFLWVLPLSLYLLTFIICFDHERWYPRRAMTVLLAVAVIGGSWGMFKGNELEVWEQLIVFCGAMFICCMVCHGELAHAKPAPEHATLFYLMVSAGGALGGLFVALVAPQIFSGYWEYPLALLATIALAFIAGQESTTGRIELPRPVWIAGGAIIVALSMAVGLVLAREGVALQSTLESTRNFYGVLRVNRDGHLTDDNGEFHELIHGTIQHGFQYIDENRRTMATSYYGHDSGVGLALERHPRRRAEAPEDRTLRIGAVGLGTGTLATYGMPGDVIQFFEINPEVVRLSEEYFTFRKDSSAKIDIIMGDARLNLEKQRDQDAPKFDVLAIDAFSSDSIPMHLLTVEAVQLYLDRLKPDGILCIHISNRYLDLDGVCLAIAQKLNWPIVMIDSPGELQLGTNKATWMLLTKNEEFLRDEAVKEAIATDWLGERAPVLWTDDYGSLWQVME